MNPRLAPASVLVWFALLGGALQLLATVALGMASVDGLATAAAEGSGYYLLGATGIGLGLAAVWYLRRRVIVATLTFLALQLLVFWPIAGRTSVLGLAFHGESILHHFVSLVAGAACLAVAVKWLRHGAARSTISGGPAALAAGALLLIHVLVQPGIGVEVPDGVEASFAALLLVSPLIATAALWNRAGPMGLRIVLIVLLVPIALRVILAWPDGLGGGSVPDSGRTILMASVVGSATLTFFLFRPDAAPRLRVLVMVLCALATAVLYLNYTTRFGKLEDDIGGVAHSLFGFTPPYPNYVPLWQLMAVMLGIFFIFTVVNTALVSYSDRARGLALGLLAITGLGLSNPQLVLMAGAALLLFVDSLVETDARTPAADPPAPIEDILGAVAQEVGLPEPVVLSTSAGSVMALRGDLDDTAVDLRARPVRAGGWELVLRTGIMGRGRPDVELVPDPGDTGQRPPHEIGRTHRVRGSVRALERLGDGPLDSLRPFGAATAKFWPAGAEIQFGRDLSAVDSPVLITLLRALSAR